MGIKHLLIYLSLLVFSLNTLWAQKVLSEKEKETFKQKVRDNAKNTQSIKSDFSEEKHISVLANKVESKGSLTYLGPDNIKWEYTYPLTNVTVIKGERLYNNTGDKTSQVNLNSNKAYQQLNRLILNSIKGDLFDEVNFEISYLKTDAQLLVKFIPKEKRFKKMIPSMELNFNKDTAQLEGIRINEKNGDFTQIRFINQKINVPLKKDVFKI